jgi:hypothetical protein
MLIKLKKHEFKKKKTNLSETFKVGLISQNHNPWNLRPELNQEAQFTTNLMLNYEIEKKK